MRNKIIAASLSAAAIATLGLTAAPALAIGPTVPVGTLLTDSATAATPGFLVFRLYAFVNGSMTCSSANLVYTSAAIAVGGASDLVAVSTDAGATGATPAAAVGSAVANLPNTVYQWVVSEYSSPATDPANLIFQGLCPNDQEQTRTKPVNTVFTDPQPDDDISGGNGNGTAGG